MRKLTRLTFVLVLLAVNPVQALAQTPPQAPVPERKGFVIGFSVGVSTAPCDPCENTPGASGAFLGGMLTERLALLFDVGANFYSDARGRYSHVVGGPTVQYFVSDRLWIKGGVGVSELMVDDADGPVRLGFFGAAGVELLQRKRYALDLSVRMANGRQPGGGLRNTSVQLGLVWY